MASTINSSGQLGLDGDEGGRRGRGGGGKVADDGGGASQKTIGPRTQLRRNKGGRGQRHSSTEVLSATKLPMMVFGKEGENVRLGW